MPGWRIAPPADDTLGGAVLGLLLLLPSLIVYFVHRYYAERAWVVSITGKPSGRPDELTNRPMIVLLAGAARFVSLLVVLMYGTIVWGRPGRRGQLVAASRAGVCPAPWTGGDRVVPRAARGVARSGHWWRRRRAVYSLACCAQAPLWHAVTDLEQGSAPDP